LAKLQISQKKKLCKQLRGMLDYKSKYRSNDHLSFFFNFSKGGNLGWQVGLTGKICKVP
jgi:hypothetical protein